MKRHIGFVFLSTLTLTFALAGSATAYTGDYPKMQIRIAWPDAAQAEVLRTVPGLDPMEVTAGEEIILVSHPEQIERLTALGFDVQVLIEDMEEFYAAQRSGYRNFGLLYTYSEMVEQLDELHSLYPDITTEKFSIATSLEGRTVWAIKVSDNPDIEEDEPEVLFDALHHAREPITVNVLIETIRTLCENYGSDPEITFLVDNREVWFVPVMNPDGYVYNEQQYPGGGGMWRKNRRDNVGSSCYGVDMNRNYPYEWAYPGGSSSDPCAEDYHGTGPATEPPVQGLVNLMNSHEFVTHDSYHSVAGCILFPWGYTSAHCPDDALFREIGAAMSEFNGYPYGQAIEMIYYTASGNTFDYAYGEQTIKNKIMSFCTEVDGSGFWPSDSEVDGLVAENVPKNIYLMKIAGSYPAPSGVVLSGGNEDQKPDPGETLDLVVNLHNESLLGDAENVAVTIASTDAYLQLHQAAANVGTIPAGGDGSNAADPFSFTVDAACPVGHALTIRIDVVADDFAVSFDQTWLVGDLPVLFADEMEAGAGDWTHDIVLPGFNDQWHMSTQRNHTSGGTTSWKFGDTGGGDYTNLADGALTTPPVAVGTFAQLTFWHWMDSEVSAAYPGRAYDGGLIEISRDGGPWEQVTPEAGYTHTVRAGGTPGPFPEGTPIFAGTFDWREDLITLSGDPGEVQLRFRFGSDGAATAEGWYVDDVSLAGTESDNTAPTAPTLVAPANGSTVPTTMPTLIVTNAFDPDPGTTLTYGFRVYADPLLTNQVAAVTGVPEGATTSSWTVSPALSLGTYYWHAYADDGIERGLCMDVASFQVEGGQGIAEAVRAPALHLLGASPNPAPGQTTLRFELASGGPVVAEIFDLQGRRITQLSARLQSGTHGLVWDGRDEAGQAVAAGVYLFSLRSGAALREGRLLLVR